MSRHAGRQKTPRHIKIRKEKKVKRWHRGYGSVVRTPLYCHGVLGSIPSTEKQNKTKRGWETEREGREGRREKRKV